MLKREDYLSELQFCDALHTLVVPIHKYNCLQAVLTSCV